MDRLFTSSSLLKSSNKLSFVAPKAMGSMFWMFSVGLLSNKRRIVKNLAKLLRVESLRFIVACGTSSSKL